jgi:DNA (cytosine-5)-methyltransferase 1
MHRKPILGDILHPQNGSEVDLDEGRFTQPCGKVLKKYILTNNLWNYLQTYADKHRAKGNGFGFGLVKADQTTRTLSARYYKDGSEILIDRGPRKNPRRLTPRECARLMGYPETFRIPVSDTRAYKQFGNSVVVPLIAHVGKLMAPWVMAIKSCAASDRDSVCTG